MEEHINYIRSLFAPEDNELIEIEERIKKNTDPIQIYPEEGKVLQFLIKASNIKSIVEIGTLAGYSTIWMARALPKDGHIYTIEKDEARFQLAELTFKNSASKDKITLIHDDASKALDKLEKNAPFDMIFIDADKLHYLDYLDWTEKNIKIGGLIIADNTLLSGAVHMDELPRRIRPTTAKNMKIFNQRLSDPNKYCSIMLNTSDGMTIALKL